MGLGFALASAGLQAFGAAYGAAATYNAEKYNATLAQQNAQIALDQAAEEETRFRRQAQRQQGTFLAVSAASGLRFSGSVQDAYDDLAISQELDALTIRYRGAMTARGYNIEAKGHKMAARNALIGGTINVGASLLGSAGSVGGQSLLMGEK